MSTLARRHFDLTACRHVMHSIPHPERVLAELARVTRPGGYLHLIPEDYGMLHFERASLDPRDFWHRVPVSFGAATGTDLFIGRHIYRLLAEMKLEQVAVNYVVVDTLRAACETFAAIIEAWRDGYVESICEYTQMSRKLATAYFNQMISNIGDPSGYAIWMVPVVTARVPS